LQRIQFKRIEAILHSAKESPTFLSTVPVAALVFRAFEWLEENKGWLIYAATIMPNHVHLLMRHREGGDCQLSRDLGVLKGFTAHEANKCLGRTGQPFWMDESFDHWCRTDDELHGIAGYIAQNPVKAGLVGCWTAWPWTRVSPEYVADAESGLASQAGMPDLPASSQAGMPDLPASSQAGMPDLRE
jgi:REP element-mobilizing transposase RayT